MNILKSNMQEYDKIQITLPLENLVCFTVPGNSIKILKLQAVLCKV